MVTKASRKFSGPGRPSPSLERPSPSWNAFFFEFLHRGRPSRDLGRPSRTSRHTRSISRQGHFRLRFSRFTRDGLGDGPFVFGDGRPLGNFREWPFLSKFQAVPVFVCCSFCFVLLLYNPVVNSKILFLHVNFVPESME